MALFIALPARAVIDVLQRPVARAMVPRSLYAVACVAAPLYAPRQARASKSHYRAMLSADQRGAFSTTAAAGAAPVVTQPIVLVKIGVDGNDADVALTFDELPGMRRMALLRALKAEDAFAVKLRDVPLDDCTVWLLPRVAGKKPTAVEEAAAVELEGADTIGDVLSAQRWTPSRLLFLRVRLPARFSPPSTTLGIASLSSTTTLGHRDHAIGSSEARVIPDVRPSNARAEPLAFVNRYAEALDVLMPNLANHESLRCGSRIKYSTPLAAQPPGTGKTQLGANITAILRRPREVEPAEAAAIATRLRNAWCWQGGHTGDVDTALKDKRDENMVMRTLLASYPHHEETLLQLKHAQPLIIEMKALVPPEFGFSFVQALAYAIFCTARESSGRHIAASVKSAFLALDVQLQSATGLVRQLIQETGAPAMLVLDDIPDLQHPRFAEYFKTVDRETQLHRAMTVLSLELQLLHGIPRCFVYCTGRSLWLSSRALEGAVSPLVVTPTLLQPLTPSDVERSLSLTMTASGQRLLESMGIADKLVPYFTRRVVQVTGGVGRALQHVLRAQYERSRGASILKTPEEVDAAIDALQPYMPSISGMLMRVRWDGPSDGARSQEIPAWAQETKEQVRLIHLFARLLLLDAPFAPDLSIELVGERLRVADAAVVLGFSYAPVTAAPADLHSTSASHLQPNLLRLVAGQWLCRSLATEPSITGHPAALVSVQLLATMRSFGGTMKGRPFEMLCADALCFRSRLTPGKKLAELLPHLSCSVHASQAVPALVVVALPKVSSAERLSDENKKELLLRRNEWKGQSTVHLDDLPWILSEWMPEGTLGVPANAQSGSQDLFLRLKGGVVGFALKAASASAGTSWGDIRDELSKAPKLPAHVPYSLVLWSLHLAAEPRTAVRNVNAATYGAGAWCFSKGELVSVTAAGAARTIEVSTGMELVIANPHTPTGGGLQQLLGSRTLDALLSMSSLTESLQIAHLASWMAAQAVVSPDA